MSWGLELCLLAACTASRGAGVLLIAGGAWMALARGR